MKLFFSPDSWMYRLLGRIMDLFFLNLLFLVTSLPVVTIGISLTALYTVTLKIVQEEDSSIVKAYLKAFKSNFKRGLILSLIMIVMFSLLIISFGFLRFLKGFSIVIGIFGCALLALLLVIQFIYLFPYTARYEDSLSNSLRVSVQVALLNLKKTFLLIGIIVALGLLATWGNVMFALMGLLFFSIGFSGISLVISAITLPTFQKYEHA